MNISPIVKQFEKFVSLSEPAIAKANTKVNSLVSAARKARYNAEVDLNPVVPQMGFTKEAKISSLKNFQIAQEKLQKARGEIDALNDKILQGQSVPMDLMKQMSSKKPSFEAQSLSSFNREMNIVTNKRDFLTGALTNEKIELEKMQGGLSNGYFQGQAVTNQENINYRLNGVNKPSNNQQKFSNNNPDNINPSKRAIGFVSS